jgi:hypothetical protein
MSDPVGNAPRVLAGGNSHQARAAAEAASAPAPQREKLQSVVKKGTVIQKKPNILKRVGRSMVADDVHDVGDFVVTDILVPALRNLLYDVVVGGAGRTIFGSAQARRPGVNPGLFGTAQNLKTAYHAASNPQAAPVAQPGLTKQAQARFDFSEISLTDHSEAMYIIELLKQRVADYGTASVADLYDLLGHTGAFTDQNWGWNDLSVARVHQNRAGFVLDLPHPVPLKR